MLIYLFCLVYLDPDYFALKLVEGAVSSVSSPARRFTIDPMQQSLGYGGNGGPATGVFLSIYPDF